MNYDNPYIVDISTLNISIPYYPDYGIDGTLPVSTREKMTEVAQEACFHTREAPYKILCALYQNTPIREPERSEWGRMWLPYAQYSSDGPHPVHAYHDKSDEWYENIYESALIQMKNFLVGNQTDAVQIRPWKVGLIELEVIHSITCPEDLLNENFKETHTICYQYSLCPGQHWTSGLPTTNTEWKFAIIHDLRTLKRPPINT